MKRITICMAGLFLTLQSLPAFAQTCANLAGSDFGALKMGDLYAKVPKNFVRLPECVQSPKYPEAVCAWLDPKTGIEFDGIQGMIIRKQIDLGPKNPNPALPFGLKSQDSAQIVQKKIKALKNAPALRVTKTGSGTTRVDTSCIKGDKVEMLKIEMEFDQKGVFKTLAAVIPMGDVAPDPGKPNRPLF